MSNRLCFLTGLCLKSIHINNEALVRPLSYQSALIICRHLEHKPPAVYFYKFRLRPHLHTHGRRGTMGNIYPRTDSVLPLFKIRFYGKDSGLLHESYHHRGCEHLDPAASDVLCKQFFRYDFFLPSFYTCFEHTHLIIKAG